MKTPHISMRVDKDTLAVWKIHCDEQGIDISTQIRNLMNAWCRIQEHDRQQEDLETFELDPDYISTILGENHEFL